MPSADGDGPSDHELLRRHVAGDSDAFGELFRRHRDRLWAVALRTVCDPDEAADALQDAMVSAFRRAADFRGESAVTTWLHRIVVNASLDRLRRRAARPALSAGDEQAFEALVAQDGDPARAADTRLDVDAALRILPPQQRAALVVVDMLGFSVPDRVAQRLDTVLAAEAANRNDPERAGKGSSRKATTPGRPTARRGFRLPSPRVLAPVAAAVVALAAGGYGLSLIGGGSTSSMQAASGTAPSASSSAAASAAKGAAEPAASARSQFKSSSQTVDVTPGTLRQYVEAELRLPRAERPTQPASSLVRGCVQRVAGTAPLELVQSALFEGQPTTIIVARTGQDYTAWVAGLDCSATNRDVLYLTTVPSGISGP